VEQKKISAKEAVADIKAGMPDDEMMKKYGLSAKGLQSLFAKLHRAKLITAEEYSRRAAPSEQTLEIVDEGGEKVAPSTEKSLDVLKDFAEKFKFSKEDLGRLKTASLKDIKELMEKYHVSLGDITPLLKSLGISVSSFLAEKADKLKEGKAKVAGKIVEIFTVTSHGKPV
jgi:hypothetical protein